MSSARPQVNNQSRFAFFGVIGIGLACYILISSFWQIDRNVRDAIVLTSYVANLSPGQQLTFGYGGESQRDDVDVPFQGREMSNRAFTVTRSDATHVIVTGEDDELRSRREWHKRGGQDSIKLSSGDTFETRGWLGQAGFSVELDEPSNTLRLRLANPVFREIHTESVRLVLGEYHQPIPAPIEEIFFRTRAPNGGTQAFLVWVRNDTLHIRQELDLAKTPDEQAARRQNEVAEKELRPGESWPFGTLELTYHHYARNSLLLYGVKLVLAIGLLGLALLLGPKKAWPDGLLLFGCAAFLISIGLVLSARDYFFSPHDTRFLRYLSILYYSVMILYCLRFPLDPKASGVQKGEGKRMLGALVSFIFAYGLIHSRLDQSAWQWWPGFWTIIWIIACFFGILFVVYLLTRFLHFTLGAFTAYPLSPKRFWTLVGIALMPLVIIGLTAILGGRSALTMPGIGRLYLPILLLPIIISSTALLIMAAEADATARTGIIFVTLIVVMLSIAVYRLWSYDNAGSLLLVVGMLSTFWLASRTVKLPFVLSIVILAGSLLVAVLSQSARFELAWGGEEAQVVYFDEAKNLRLARDMAKAGGMWGRGLDLTIPSGVRGNIHTDLMAAYITGFFGWGTLLLVLLSYAIFYSRLWGGLQHFFPSRVSSGTSVPTQSFTMRQILAIIGGALLLTFAIQAVYVAVQALQPSLPLMGLDLQPVSSSGSSVLSFILVLLGSVAVTHTGEQTLP